MLLQKSLRNFQHICQSSRKRSSRNASELLVFRLLKEWQQSRNSRFIAAGLPCQHTATKYSKISKKYLPSISTKNHELCSIFFFSLKYFFLDLDLGLESVCYKAYFSGKFQNFTVTIHNVNA